MSSEPDLSNVRFDGWHRVTSQEVTARLGVDPLVGLPASEASSRLAVHGPNRLPRGRRRSPLRTFVDQFRSLLVAVLVGAAVLAAIVGDVKDVIVISVVVVFNAVLGFVQEYRAETSLAALERMLVTRARVRRDGSIIVVDAEELVPGDVVLVEAGDRVPADGRWLVTVDLQIDESAFTGESMPVTKDVLPIPEGVVALADRRCMGFMNTTVTRGRGEIVVTGTGEGSEVGRLAGMLNAAQAPPTPLQREVAHLGRRLTLVAAGAVALVVVLDVVRGLAVDDILLNAVALAVAAIPEGLPAVLTVTLAVGTSQLAKRRAIVKRLSSVETLGATTIICSDKTGTLTVNKMTARRVHAGGRSFTVSGEGYATTGVITPDEDSDAVDLERLLTVCALCSDATVSDGSAVGDPTEAALVVLAAKGGIEVLSERARHPRLGEVPFESATKYMATFHDGGDHIDLYVKGAPDVLLASCSSAATRLGVPSPLDATARDALLYANHALGERGLRVLAAASRRITHDEWDPAVDPRAHVTELCFEGLVGLADPPRPEARLAIERCRRAGIDVKMITGDHAVTAGTIAAELGITGEVITGRELDQLDVDGLAARIEGIGVFARVAPEHKVAIVEALQRRNHVVAMTGDGVNDAPALKRADIGVAMGITGTEVSKEAASMVLTDDNFATIVNAVEGGRTIYDNIIKFVTFQLSTNIGAILTIITASLLNWPGDGRAFFAPLALLWLNIIMDGPPAMALGIDSPGPGTMTRPPRSPTSRILTMRRLAQLSRYGVIMTASTLLAYRLGAGAGPISDTDATRGIVVAFSTFVFLQLFNLQNARFPDHSALRRHALTNWQLWTASGTVLVLHVAAMSWDSAQMLFTGRDAAVHLSLGDWALALAAATPILILEELRKVRAARNSDA
ncbi:MAG: cation-translocating P-type ATPase [Dermatophilaceae bacterium]